MPIRTIELRDNTDIKIGFTIRGRRAFSIKQHTLRVRMGMLLLNIFTTITYKTR